MVTLVTKVMLRVQVNNENGNPRDQDRDMHIWKNELLPVLVPVVAVLIVHLNPWHGFCHPCNLKIRIPIEKLAYKHVSYSYLKKMNNSLFMAMGLPFSMVTWTTWTLEMAFVFFNREIWIPL